MVDLTDLDTLQQVLHRAGITPQRSNGQNFLVSPEVLEATLAVLPREPQLVTELGAGLGTLTQALAGASYTIRAIERDTSLAMLLPRHLAPGQRPRVTVINNDLRHEDWTWETPYHLVGNIPYNLSGWIIRRLTQLAPAPATVVLLVQQEVGERLTAQPPNMHLLTLALQLWGEAHHVLTVPPHCFWPAPQVSSQLIALLPHNPATQLPLPTREAIIAFAKPLFQQRRKQLGHTLRHITAQSATDAAQLLISLQIDPTQRPQELGVAQWQALSAAYGAATSQK